MVSPIRPSNVSKALEASGSLYVNHYEPWGVLCLAGRPGQALELPSWCPEWSTRPTKPARIGLMHLEAIEFHKKLEEEKTEADSRLQNEEEKPSIATPSKRLFQAGGTPAIDIAFSDKGTRIIVSGKILGKILSVGDALQPDLVTPGISNDEYQDAAASNRLSNFRNVLTMASAYEPRPFETRKSACTQTLLAGLSRSLQRITPDDASSWIFDSSIVTEVIVNNPLESAKEVELMKPVLLKHEKGNLEFAYIHLQVATKKAFFVSDRYVGLAPVGTVEGDRICVLQGCPLPISCDRRGTTGS